MYRVLVSTKGFPYCRYQIRKNYFPYATLSVDFAPELPELWHLPVSVLQDSNNIGLNFELDAILAVALGGNSLGGGKFRLTGSIIGAYTIQAITTTLYALGVSTEQAPVYKAVIVIIIVAIQAPPFKDYMKKMSAKRQLAKEVSHNEEKENEWKHGTFDHHNRFILRHVCSRMCDLCK